jgi:hypothetical protein
MRLSDVFGWDTRLQQLSSRLEHNRRQRNLDTAVLAGSMGIMLLLAAALVAVSIN